MKKNSAVIGTLAVAGSLIANLAMADTSTTSVSATAPKLIEKIVASYYGAYAGPSMTNPTRATTDGAANGELADVQSLDSTFTLGYKLTPELILAGNYRNLFIPLQAEGGQDLINLDPWISLRHSKVVKVGNFKMSADLRLYAPVRSAGKMNTGIRSTQIATFDIPNTRLSLGTYTILRGNLLRGGTSMPNAQASFSGFGNFQMTDKLSATAWSDIIQLDFKTGEDLSNKLIPVSLGVNWDLTPKISLNPSLNFFPATATLEKTTLGLIVSASFL